MRKWALVAVVVASVFNGTWAAGGMLATGFEFIDASGSFTLGSAPETATFIGGRALGGTTHEQFRTGRHAWLVPSGATASVRLETPVDNVCLFSRDQQDGPPSRLTAYNTDEEIVAASDASYGSWTRFCASAPPAGPFISRIELASPAGGTGLAVDDFTAGVGRSKAAMMIADRVTNRILRAACSTAGPGTAAPFAPLPASWEVAAVADLDGNGLDDLLIHDFETDTLLTVPTAEDGTAAGPEVLLEMGGRYRLVASGDFNLDGRADLLVEDGDGKSLRAFLMNGSAVEADLYLFPFPSFISCPGVGDLDGDGDADLLLRMGGLLLSVFVEGGRPAGIEVIDRRFWGSKSVVGVNDLDGDGKADLQVVDGLGIWHGWKMNGGAIVEDTLLGWLGRAWMLVGAGDADADGSRDLVLYRPETRQGRVLKLDRGRLAASLDFSHPFHPAWTPAAVQNRTEERDVDGDGLTDREEMEIGTAPDLADTDGDGIWDREEVVQFATHPLEPDSDGDGMSDREDPHPTVAEAAPERRFGVFRSHVREASRSQLLGTYYQVNHLVHVPRAVPGGPFLVFQTSLSDTNGDGMLTGWDRRASAIGIMDLDGSHPRMITDVNADGRIEDNGYTDAVPTVSPDGRYIVFISDRSTRLPEDYRLWIMDIDGSNPRQLLFPEGNGPIDGLQMDADPHWAVDGGIAFKRETTWGPSFSQVWIGKLDPVAGTITRLALRTDGEPVPTGGAHPPGDFDPRISPDGNLVASYRKLGFDLLFEFYHESIMLGDFDLWVGPTDHPARPEADSITFVEPNAETADLMPRWDRSGIRLAFWSLDPAAAEAAQDPMDIVVVELDVTEDPFSVVVTDRRNLTRNAGAPDGGWDPDVIPLTGSGWLEDMPAWSAEPTEPDLLYYSGFRFLPEETQP